VSKGKKIKHGALAIRRSSSLRAAAPLTLNRRCPLCRLVVPYSS